MQNSAASARQLSVSIYDASTGTDLLRKRGGITASNVRFTTGFPGGFLECTFTVLVALSRNILVDTGQKVIVRRGATIVWWGWIEDIERSYQGRLVKLQCMCLGPWQNCNQRLIPNFTGGELETSATISALLTSYCPLISGDRSHITTANAFFADTIDQDYVSVASVINDACKMGNSANQPMLFAIWEPSEHGQNYTVGGNPLLSPGFESGGWAGQSEGATGIAPDYTGKGRTDSYAHTGAWSAYMFSNCIDVPADPTVAYWTVSYVQAVNASPAEVYRLSF
jgi:hypothetical protein